ncbi:hypothetical protein [Hyphomicrobium sp. 99]|uniref:hypothetical protein n=1 Tax=Hyphomicrobium sp. 99 TaxID=1163419 RepID=UPI0005F84098|nr:hypothetical protein [Hyphomicrobium sp. 99]
MVIKTRLLGYALAVTSTIMLSALNDQIRHVVVADALAGCRDDNRSWDELSYGARRAWMMLGYNRSVWDSNGSSRLETANWSQLSPRQRQAAAALGYTQQSWDNDCGADIDTD